LELVFHTSLPVGNAERRPGSRWGEQAHAIFLLQHWHSQGSCLNKQKQQDHPRAKAELICQQPNLVWPPAASGFLHRQMGS